jgi:hypothetical protein
MYFISKNLCKIRFYIQDCNYLFSGLVILDLLTNFYQNLSNSLGVLGIFSSKNSPVSIFVAKLLAKQKKLA